METMSTSEEFDIQKIAALAKLNLTVEETKQLGNDLREIVAFVDTVMAHADREEDLRFEETGVARGDTVLPPFPRDVLLESAPASYDGYITLPVTVGEGDAT